MPTRVLLEGPAIEPLLAQVRQEYGPTARIVSADKIRTGGLGGFFARQRYEVSVEIDDLPAGAGAVESGPPAPRHAAAEGSLTGTAPAAEPMDSLLALVEASQDRYRDLPVPAEPAEATRERAKPAAVTGTATAPAPWAPPKLDARPENLIARPAAPAADPAPQMPARAGLVSTTGSAFAEIMAGLHGGLVTASTPNGADGAAAPAPAAAPTPPAPAAASTPAVAPTPAIASTPAVAPTPAVASTPPAPAAAGPAHGHNGPVIATPTGVGSRVADLIALGVPAAMAARATADDPYLAAMQALADLPAPPAAPSDRGDVLVVAGDLTRAVPVAQRAARALRLDPTRILLAGPTTAGTGLHASRRITGPAEARRRARRLHYDEVPHVVVVDAAFPAGEDGWVEEICDALGATAVWAVVDATRKTADTGRHMRSMGPVDAVAVHSLELTADPASMLGLDAPVALLDDQPATAHAWASLLAERLRPAPERRRGRRTRGA